MWRKGNLCVLLGGMYAATMETVWSFLKKLKLELPYDPTISLLGIYLKKMKTLIWKDICTCMFIAALLTIAKTWQQPVSNNGWMAKENVIIHINYILYV